MSKITFLGLISIVLFAVIITKLASVITVNYDFQSYSQEEYVADKETPVSASNHQKLVVGASASNLMWFLQVNSLVTR